MSEFKPSERVRYVPSHAQGDQTHPDCEDGTVSSVSEKGTTVFVRFDKTVARIGLAGATSQGCYPEDLIKLTTSTRAIRAPGTEPVDEIGNLADDLLDQMSPRRQEVAIVASSHDYRCRCEHCLEWWAAVGPDGEEAGNYGPFHKDEVNAMQVKLGYQITP
jgi:hypothetical protein